MLLNDNPQFVPFFGLVEDVDDPKKLGRVKVRVYNQHDNLEVDDLDWFAVGNPTTSAGLVGIGTSPTWLEVGALVYGFYFDGVQKASPIVIGTMNTIPGGKEQFHSVNKIARGTPQEITSAAPNVAGAPQYPNAKVIETPTGHIIEVDDTPGNERLLVKHKSGSFVAINKDGDVIIQSAHDSYHLVSGEVKETIKGKMTTKAKEINITSEGKLNITTKGAVMLKSSAKVTIAAPNVSIE